MYYYYAPSNVQSAPAAAQAAPQAFGGIRDIIDIIKMVGEIRGELRGNIISPKPETSTATSVDLTSVQASLGRLEAGQADLRGRLINAAGVHQTMGKTLVEIQGAVNRSDLHEQIIGKLEAIREQLSKPPAPSPPAPAPPETPKAGATGQLRLPNSKAPVYMTKATWVERR
jgi:hypothetical protein